MIRFGITYPRTLGAAALALGLWGAVAQAAPAPWYWWVSKVDEQRVCAQSMPEQGWERAEGPFTRSDCQR
ncbi:hypothetical protein [Comamonas sp. GB3 AK4-5]|uniref:hypothetical protein n=1 Tax=Comamonas sp. GB3 AK4-5 TaxID=3231487 RepID=UPI00351F4451